ncbi:MAG: hypothetical protein H6811_10590 [Phycisphaeraceae bacterium]|nr:hypothetical protein [Phycisphaeraceae bacterium]
MHVRDRRGASRWPLRADPVEGVEQVDGLAGVGALGLAQAALPEVVADGVVVLLVVVALDHVHQHDDALGKLDGRGEMGALGRRGGDARDAHGVLGALHPLAQAIECGAVGLGEGQQRVVVAGEVLEEALGGVGIGFKGGGSGVRGG